MSQGDVLASLQGWCLAVSMERHRRCAAGLFATVKRVLGALCITLHKLLELDGMVTGKWSLLEMFLSRVVLA